MESESKSSDEDALDAYKGIPTVAYIVSNSSTQSVLFFFSQPFLTRANVLCHGVVEKLSSRKRLRLGVGNEAAGGDGC